MGGGQHNKVFPHCIVANLRADPAASVYIAARRSLLSGTQPPPMLNVMTNEPGEHMCTGNPPFPVLQAHTGSPPHVGFNKQTSRASVLNGAFPRVKERAACRSNMWPPSGASPHSRGVMFATCPPMEVDLLIDSRNMAPHAQ